jgi:hypothetical protein
MNPFVNLQKRSIQLPKGCKDLIDVLRQPRARGIVRERGELAHIEHCLSRLLQSAAKRKALFILSLDGQAACVLAHHDGVLAVTVWFECRNSVREEAVRGLFVEAGINPTMDDVKSSAGVPMRGLAYPLPTVAPRAAQLTAELMRRAYGVTEEASLVFLYDERDAA